MGVKAGEAAAALARGVLKSMFVHKLKVTVVVFLAIMGSGVLAWHTVAAGDGDKIQDTSKSLLPQSATHASERPPDKTTRVQEPREPAELSLYGVTDYDPMTVTVVRTPFGTRLDKVLVELGTTVKKGDDLLELFSTDLAAAKWDYEMARSRWDRADAVLDYMKSLAERITLPKKELIKIQNDEAHWRLKLKLAKDKLLSYGLTEKEVEHARNEDGVQKARMIIRSQVEGVVVKRSVVQGNYYDSEDELLTIAALDHLWVRGNVSETDAEKVVVGQTLKVVLPFSVSGREITAKVDFIDKAIDPKMRSAHFRAAIPNPGGRLKAGLFVKIRVQIPPRAVVEFRGQEK
jgi:cobalt-zinc-cadmium efflux system membrane fusion protein